MVLLIFIFFVVLFELSFLQLVIFIKFSYFSMLILLLFFWLPSFLFSCFSIDFVLLVSLLKISHFISYFQLFESSNFLCVMLAYYFYHLLLTLPSFLFEMVHWTAIIISILHNHFLLNLWHNYLVFSELSISQYQSLSLEETSLKHLFMRLFISSFSFIYNFVSIFKYQLLDSNWRLKT